MDEERTINWSYVSYRAKGAIAVVIAFAVLLGGGWYTFDWVRDTYVQLTTPDDDYVGEGKDDVEVVIPRGAGITQIGDILYEAGVVKSVRKFRSVASRSGRSNELHFGRFKLRKELPAKTAFEMLLDPKNIERLKVVFPEGWTVTQQHDRIRNKLGVSEDAVTAAVNARGELGLPDWANNSLEGFLFPASYDVEEPVNPFNVMKSQVNQFKTVASRVGLEKRAAEIGRTPLEVLTVASIIEAEVHIPEYQPLVAAVIYNRLEKGMKLEMDSTVHYVVGKKGKVTTTREDRNVESPYNTYYAEGLPPGPISNPGESAIRAALSPPETEDLFFVTVDLDTGETKFAPTREEHDKNVLQFQAFCSANPGRC